MPATSAGMTGWADERSAIRRQRQRACSWTPDPRAGSAGACPGNARGCAVRSNTRRACIVSCPGQGAPRQQCAADPGPRATRRSVIFLCVVWSQGGWAKPNPPTAGMDAAGCAFGELAGAILRHGRAPSRPSTSSHLAKPKDMDARDKRGHDGMGGWAKRNRPTAGPRRVTPTANPPHGPSARREPLPPLLRSGGAAACQDGRPGLNGTRYPDATNGQAATWRPGPPAPRGPMDFAGRFCYLPPLTLVIPPCGSAGRYPQTRSRLRD